jgi:hypothetical protein
MAEEEKEDQNPRASIVHGRKKHNLKRKTIKDSVSDEEEKSKDESVIPESEIEAMKL